MRVVDDQHVGALAGRSTTHRGGDAMAPGRGLQFMLLVLIGGRREAGEQPAIPGGRRHQAEIQGVANAELAAVARRHDAP